MANVGQRFRYLGPTVGGTPTQLTVGTIYEVIRLSDPLLGRPCVYTIGDHGQDYLIYDPTRDAHTRAHWEEIPERFAIFNATRGKILGNGRIFNSYELATRRAQDLARGFNHEYHIIPLRSVTKVTRGAVEDYRNHG